jgi:hypothetical protein
MIRQIASFLALTAVALVGTAIGTLVAALVVWPLWNYTAPTFRLPELDFWHVWAALMLLGCLRHKPKMKATAQGR